MNNDVPPALPSDVEENLLKDGGRKVLDGGNPYEDDLEPAAR